jgi:hypothetical protein
MSDNEEKTWSRKEGTVLKCDERRGERGPRWLGLGGKGSGVKGETDARCDTLVTPRVSETLSTIQGYVQCRSGGIS